MIDFARDVHRLKPHQSRLPAKSVAILQVCRQTHQEVESILYKYNRFAFAGYHIRDDARLFLSSISIHAYHNITTVSVYMYNPPNRWDHSYLDLLAGCESLKYIFIRGPRSSNRPRGQMVGKQSWWCWSERNERI